MKKILILGASGKLGKVLTEDCLNKEYSVIALLRNPNKLKIKNTNLKIISGDVTDEKDLNKALNGIEGVISVLGHGFRTNYPIQEKTMSKLIPLMEKRKINKIITITGAGLKTKEDPKSLTLDISDKLFKIIDPYRMNDSKKQQDLLEKSKLNWTVVRTPIHSDGKSKTINFVGYNQPRPWQKISRIAISNFMIKLLENDNWNKKSPIIY